MPKAAEPSQAAELVLQQARSRRRAAAMRRAAALRCAQKICALGHTSGIERDPCWLPRAPNGEVIRQLFRILVMVISKSCRITNSFEISFCIAHFIQRTSAGAARLAAGNSGPVLLDVRDDMQLASDSRIDPTIGMMSRTAS